MHRSVLSKVSKCHCYFSTTTVQPKVATQRYRWTKERDEQLKHLIANRNGRTLSDIAKELGITGDPVKVQSRLKVLQAKEHGMWTKREDTDLTAAIQRCTQAGHTLGDHASWVFVARRLKTNRTPSQCQSRWVRTLFPKQGMRVEHSRFSNIRAWAWQPDETDRLRRVLDQITRVRDPDTEVQRAAETEPWLLVNQLNQGNRVTQFWKYIASCVGTRTPMQCRRKWEDIAFKNKSTEMTTQDAVRLAQLVKTRGTKWQLLVKEEFPDKTAQSLWYTHTRWKSMEKKYGVDFLQIDPKVRLRNYDGRTALRPTGADGFYDPNGPLARVYTPSKTSALTPYVLSCINSRFQFRDQTGLQIVRLPGSSAQTRISPATVDKLMAAISSHKDDWISISRAMKLPPSKCRKYAEALATKIPLIKRLLHNAEIAELGTKV
ncbi:hypothetical protein J3F80_001997 [Coemansia sp. RSA 2526]|nr:hypothetical protein J3F80_001997 [Coemansia sp. RSA 2526]